MIKIKTRSPLPWIRLHKFYSLFLFIFVLVGGVFVYEKVALELNKRAFTQARVAIDTVYVNIVKETGEPSDFSESYGCGGFQGVLGEGPLSCYINKRIAYSVSDATSLDQLKTKVQATIDTSKLLIPEAPPPSDASITEIAPNSNPPKIDYYRTRSGVSCKVTSETDGEQKLAIFFACSGPARGKYF